MKTLNTLTLLAVVATSAQAGVINVDVNGTSDTQIAVTTGFQAAAADPAGASAVWNVATTLTGDDLVDSTGTVTTVDFAITGANGIFHQGSGQSANPIFRDYAFDNSTPEADRSVTFTLSGLTAGDTYQLYIYGGTQFDNPVANTQTIEIDGTVETINYAGNNTTFVEGENYALFEGTVPVSGELSAELLSTTLGEPTINGFQIVTVPEPSSTALSLLAVAGLALRRRR